MALKTGSLSKITSGLSSSLKSTASSARKSISSSSRSSSSSGSGLLSSIGKSVSSATRNSSSRTGSSSGSSLLSSIGKSISSATKSSSSGSSLLSGLTSRIGSSSSKTTGAYSKISQAAKSGSSGILTSIFKSGSGSSTGSSSGGILSSLTKKYASGGSSSGLTSLFKSSSSTSSSSRTSGSTILSSLFSLGGNNKSKSNVTNAINSLKNNISNRTSSGGILSGLLNRSNNSSTSGTERISNLNVFGGLKNLISGAKSNINTGDGKTKINTMGILGLSTALTSSANRIQSSFDNWKSKLGLLSSTGIMQGSSAASSEKAASSMTSLFGKFSEYSQNMSNKLFGVASSSESADKGAGVAGAVADLSKESNVGTAAGLFGLTSGAGSLISGIKSSDSGSTFMPFTSSNDSSGFSLLPFKSKGESAISTLLGSGSGAPKSAPNGANVNPQKYGGQCVGSTRSMYQDVWGSTLPYLGTGQPAYTMKSKCQNDPNYHVSSTPTVGAAVCFQPGVAGAGDAGHMAQVTGVQKNPDGSLKSITVAETNYGDHKSGGTRTIPASQLASSTAYITPA